MQTSNVPFHHMTVRFHQMKKLLNLMTSEIQIMMPKCQTPKQFPMLMQPTSILTETTGKLMFGPIRVHHQLMTKYPEPLVSLTSQTQSRRQQSRHAQVLSNKLMLRHRDHINAQCATSATRANITYVITCGCTRASCAIAATSAASAATS